MNELRIELICTGTELLLGSTINTNAAWLGQRLFEEGLRVSRVSTVPDGGAVAEAMRESCSRADCVIVTGGLGPTSDDVTREALCEVCGLTMRRNECIADDLTAYFTKHGLPTALCNYRQAMVPEGAEILPNSNGTAPGILLAARRGFPMFVLLPGPPAEMKSMADQSLFPYLRNMIKGETPRLRIYRVIALGESDLHDLVDEALHGIPGLEIAYCAHIGEVEVRLIGLNKVLDDSEQMLYRLLGNKILPKGVTCVEEALVSMLWDRQLTIATAESCTGGLIAKRLTDVSGSSSVFSYGWVTYANEAKTRELGVVSDILDRHGAVSEEVVRAMAEGALKNSGAAVAVAVSGIAGPEGGSKDKPVGTVWLAWAFRNRETYAEKQFFSGTRELVRQKTAQRALVGLWTALH